MLEFLVRLMVLRLQCYGKNSGINIDNFNPGVARCNLFFCVIVSRIYRNKLYAQLLDAT